MIRQGAVVVEETQFSTVEAAALAGVSYRQCDYWARTNLVGPSLAGSQGSGSSRVYSYEDLVKLRLVGTLLDHGIRLERVRLLLDGLTSSEVDLRGVHLVITPTEAFVVRTDVLVEGVVRDHLNEVLTIIALDVIMDELNQAIQSSRAQ